MGERVHHFIQAKETCKDLHPHGCVVNPDACKDPIMAMVTCPRTCNICGQSLYFLKFLIKLVGGVDIVYISTIVALRRLKSHLFSLILQCMGNTI